MEIYTCDICCKSWSRKYNYERHRNRKNKCKNQKDEIKKLKSKMKKIKKIKKIKNNTHININNFGTEDYNCMIDNKTKSKFLDYGFCLSDALLDYIHFDKKKPNNHNVYVSNFQKKIIRIYDNGKWIIGNTNEILNEIKNKCIDFVYENHKILTNMDDEKKTNYKKTIEILHMLLCEYFFTDANDKTLYNNILMKLYNRRQIVIDTIKLLKTNDKMC